MGHYAPHGGVNGGSHPKIFSIFCGHVIYQMKGNEKSYSELQILYPYDPLFDRQQLEMTQKWLLLTNILLRGACPHRMSYEAENWHGQCFMLIFSKSKIFFEVGHSAPPPTGA